MIYKKLGDTDITVSKICLGTMTFGEQTSEVIAHEQIDYALSQGINFVDTAEMYSVPGRAETQGSTERYIGSWIKENKKNRQELILGTKVTGPSPLFNYISADLGFNPGRLKEALEGSLKRLNTDYIDIYQLHWPERKTNCFGVLGYTSHDAEWQDNFEACIQTMNEFNQAGKVRYWGLSNETPWGVMRSFEISRTQGFDRPASIQNPYNLLNRTFEIGLSEITLREKISLLAYSPMAFGLLSGKYYKGKDKPTSRINQFSRLSRYNGLQAREAAAKYIELAEQAGLSPAQMALAFVQSRTFVTSTIIGATDMEQLKENIGSVEIVLDDALLQAIDDIHKGIPNPAP
ncbi:MAG: aldo/keto reductase [Saprospiraceae bacterium]|nr:aldo/keto reductase [Saprospiraceae bacterium]